MKFEDEVDILQKITVQLATIIELLKKIEAKDKPVIPPDCEHI